MTGTRTHDITCNERNSYFSENLHHFLLCVGTGLINAKADFLSLQTFLWIDAICIDQDSKSERSQEVLKMGMIYSSAVQTISWLGNSDELTKNGFEFVEAISRADPESLQTLPLDLPSLSQKLSFTVAEKHMNALVKLFSRTYFIRVWVVQEVVASRKSIIACGGYTLAMETLEDASMKLAHSPWRAILGSYRAIDSRFGLP